MKLIELRYSPAAAHHDGLRECLYQSLLKWRLREPENCTFSYLYQVMCSCVAGGGGGGGGALNRLVNAIEASRDEKEEEERGQAEIDRLRLYLSQVEAKKKRQGKYVRREFREIVASDSGDQLSGVRLDERQLWAGSELICAEWKAIMRVLGLAESSLVQIESRHMQSEGLRECAYQGLIAWSQIWHEQCHLERICLSLMRIGLNLYAKQFLELALFE